MTVNHDADRVPEKAEGVEEWDVNAYGKEHAVHTHKHASRLREETYWAAHPQALPEPSVGIWCIGFVNIRDLIQRVRSSPHVFIFPQPCEHH